MIAEKEDNIIVIVTDVKQYRGRLSWKNCTGFPFQNVLSIKSLVCVSVL